MTATGTAPTRGPSDAVRNRERLGDPIVTGAYGVCQICLYGWLVSIVGAQG